MPDIESGRELGLALCEALGISPEMVGKITIIADAGDVAKVIVERPVLRPTSEHLVGAVRSLVGTKKIKIDWVDPERSPG